MKIALVHDFLIYWGGAERVLRGFHTMFPEAPIYTLFYDESFTKRFFPNAVLLPSFLKPYARFGHRWLFPFMPSAAESLNVNSFDVVISSGIFSKGIITKPQTCHIHYCHTPPRFLWEESREYLDSVTSFFSRPFASLALHWLRIWDRAASERVDTYIANSQWTKARVKKIYHQEAKVIYPFVDELGTTNYESKFNRNVQLPIPHSYFLIVSRMQKYKNIELPIKVFNTSTLPLVIAGTGPDEKRLKKMANQNIIFLGFVKEEELSLLYRNAKAVVLPGIEDFGLTTVEAMAQGTPVFAYRKGGASETIAEGKTGEFFDEPTPKNFYAGLRRLVNNIPSYKAHTIKKYASKFSFQRFKKEILSAIRTR